MSGRSLSRSPLARWAVAHCRSLQSACEKERGTSPADVPRSAPTRPWNTNRRRRTASQSQRNPGPQASGCSARHRGFEPLTYSSGGRRFSRVSRGKDAVPWSPCPVRVPTRLQRDRRSSAPSCLLAPPKHVDHTGPHAADLPRPSQSPPFRARRRCGASGPAHPHLASRETRRGDRPRSGRGGTVEEPRDDEGAGRGLYG